MGHHTDQQSPTAARDIGTRTADQVAAIGAEDRIKSTRLAVQARTCQRTCQCAAQRRAGWQRPQSSHPTAAAAKFCAA